MVIPEEPAVQFATDLLASTLPTTPAQEDISAHSSSATSALDVPALNSLECIAELSPTSETVALLDTIIVPPSSLTTGLISFGKIPLIFLSLFFIHVHGF